MSLFKNIFAVIVLSATLSACGFQPLHGSQNAASSVYNSIAIENIPDRDGQYLRNQLIDRLYSSGMPEDPAYVLRVTQLNKDITNVGIKKDASYTRAEMKIDAHVQLIESVSGAIVLDRKLRAVGSYNLLDNQFATLVSRESQTDYTLKDLSDNIVTELNLFFNRGG